MRRGVGVCVVIIAVSAGLSRSAVATAPRWRIQPAPNPAARYDWFGLNAVACPSTTSCVAGGYYYPPGVGVPPIPYIERWNGTKWSIEKPPVPSNDEFNAVACPSASFCIAIAGSSAAKWNGHTWSAIPQLRYIGGNGVACTSATFCVTVGFGAPMRWNGTKWFKSNNPLGVDDILNGVACVSPTDCTAVGYKATSPVDGYAVAAHWNGSTWTRQAVAPVPHRPDSSLARVSCPSVHNCWAVGTSLRTYDDVTRHLVEHWNGTKWSIVVTPAPPPTSGDVSLRDISCVGSTCVAVGDSGHNATPWIDRWNGSTWRIDTTTTPPKSDETTLHGVACVTPATCVTVGDYFSTDTGDMLLIERSG